MPSNTWETVRSGGFRRYTTTNSTQATAGGNALLVPTAGAACITAANLATFTVFPLSNCLVARIIFFGTTTAAQTFTANIWGVSPLTLAPPSPGVQSVSGPAINQIDLTQQMVFNLGTATAITLGTSTGVANGTSAVSAVLATELFAKAMTWTASGNATTIPGPLVPSETSLSEGTSSAFSPATFAGGIAMLFLPNMARFTGLIVDFTNSGGTAVSMNCLISTGNV